MDPKMLSDHELLARVKALAAAERAAMTALIAHLAELDGRRLYLAEGCSSLFTYCTQILHLTEHAAYGRIEAARAFRKFPILLDRLEDGSVNLTTVTLLAAHLTGDNYLQLLEAASHKSKRQVEELVARLHPQPPIPAAVRQLPPPRRQGPGFVTPSRSGPSPAAPSPDHASSSVTTPADTRPAVVCPLAPQRYKIQFTANTETVEKLRRAQGLLRHQIPNADPATIFDLALTALLESLAKKRLAATDRPRGGNGTAPGSRHIPAAVKRAVWLRDSGRCTFVTSTGRRCTEDGFLEFHHVKPFAAGGESTEDNVQLRCRTHNGYEATLYFGLDYQERIREERPDYLGFQS